MAMKPIAERITEALQAEPGLTTDALAKELRVPVVQLSGTLSAMLYDNRLKVDGTGDYRRWYVGMIRSYRKPLVAPAPKPAPRTAGRTRTHETVADFLARGGRITYLDSIGNPTEDPYDPDAPDPDDAINPNTNHPYTYAELASGD